MLTIQADNLDWLKGDGLIPVVIQDVESSVVLMLGYMNRAAFDQTIASGYIFFFSRARQCLWKKGETSGNTLQVVNSYADCDNDTLLFQVKPQGPTCHLGSLSCFKVQNNNYASVLNQLQKLIANRAQSATSADSYTASLLTAGLNRIAQKVGEEAVETVVAAVAQDDESLLAEVADLVYHLLVLLYARNLSLARVIAVLEQRSSNVDAVA
jgi:phosphoribosyl-AMP cyclohydrolase / phosphoribosyl-ATP pyrophosphohydrolase